MLSAAQMLDELMGKDRNITPGEQSMKNKFTDDEVCKFYLCGFCPHDLFVNTKADLGICSKVHDEGLKKDYEKSSRCGKLNYEEEFQRFLQSVMTDVERRIRRGHERLALNASRERELSSNTRGSGNDNSKVEMISEHIDQLLEKVEELGSEGNVEEAQGMIKLVDQLKEEQEQLTQMNKLNPLGAQEKQMEVCEVCGAFLIVGDAQSRVDDHLQGKQHMGYAKIKSTLEDMRQGKKLKRGDDIEEEISEKKDDMDEDKESRRRRSREDDNDGKKRSRSRERRKRSRSRERSRRSRSSERRRRSRSNERRQRSRSAERSRRSRSPKRGQQSRSGDRSSRDERRRVSSSSHSRDSGRKRSKRSRSRSKDRSSRSERRESRRDDSDNSS